MKQVLYTKQLINSNYGRKIGWLFEYKGKIVAELEDPQSVEMFGKSYRIIPSSKETKKIAYNHDLWGSCEFIFITKVTEERVTDAWAGGAIEKIIENNRVTLRGLYLVPRNTIEYRLMKLYEVFHQP